MVRDKIDATWLYYFNNGKLKDAYNIFGAHLVKENNKTKATEFVLYCPNVKNVYIILESYNFKGYELKMEQIDNSGIYYYYLEGNHTGEKYKYQIITFDNRVIYKADPYAFYSALRPLTDSIIYDIDGYNWEDDIHLEKRAKFYENPLAIYEMHLGSWKRPNDGREFLSYVEIANELIPYLNYMGFNAVEFMPIYEYPLDDSWGYMGTCYYSINSRYGRPKDFMYLVDSLHQAGISVILDWVPGHICKDEHGLYMFNGSPLYDYDEETIRENPTWGTANLDVSKGITKSLLISNACYYLEKFHIDGFRIDAVSNMIYYLGNKNYGVNEGAIGFLRELSTTLFSIDDRIILCAEDSTDHPYVTLPADMGGLGFNYKWDMGWMNDTLSYFKEETKYRKYHHNKITFGMMYNHNEEFLMPLSHDEVVHMKGSLINKMPGDYWQKFANLRLLMGYLFTRPSKKLIFMGSEFAQFDEWHFEKELNWNLFKYPIHDAYNHMMRDLLKLYKEEKALYELDYHEEGFKWVEANDSNESIFIYERFSRNPEDTLLIVMNGTEQTYFNYQVGVSGTKDYIEIFNTDKDIYGGSNKVNAGVIKNEEIPMHNKKNSISVTIAPLAVMIFKMVSE